jgi:hypothetical protein
MPGPVPTQLMQGIEVPASSVNPQQFFAQTRRMRLLEKNLAAFAGLGNTDVIPILQTGVLASLKIQFSGTLVIALPTGTAATTSRWPYDLAKAVRFTANGQSNLINCHGAALKIRENMQSTLSDRGVVRGVGGASPGTQVNQGTLSLNSENWGVGQNVTAIPANTYPVELEWTVPIAFDENTLQGAIFAQTSATDLFCAVDWAPLTDLFTLTGTATATLTGSVNAVATLYSIPQASNGNIIIPDLSVFHSLIESRVPTIGLGDNEIRLAGQGVGKQLLRIFGRTFNTGVPPTVLPVTTANYGNLLYRYGGNDTPESWPNGSILAHELERIYDTDVSSLAGWWSHDFTAMNAFRDSINEATATELRFLFNLTNGVTLTNGFAEYVQETVSIGSAA